MNKFLHAAGMIFMLGFAGGCDVNRKALEVWENERYSIEQKLRAARKLVPEGATFKTSTKRLGKPAEQFSYRRRLEPEESRVVVKNIREVRFVLVHRYQFPDGDITIAFEALQPGEKSGRASIQIAPDIKMELNGVSFGGLKTGEEVDSP
ncbi:MAG: hypothetical protein AAF492_12940 [Verrucomicrobiota bacterium]